MKIALINTWLSGGASKAAQRLYNGLVSLDSDNDYLFYIKNDKNKQFSIIPNAISLEKYTLTQKLIQKLQIVKYDNSLKEFKHLRKSMGLDYYSGIKNRISLSDNKNLNQSDIINLHWVAELLDYKRFFSDIKNPVFWTLHDESPFLYGDHYEEVYTVDHFGVVRQREKSKLEIDQELLIKEKKLKIFETVRNLQIIAPSKWMANRAANSDLFYNFKIHNIPYGLNTSVFRSLDKSFAKETFGLPTDQKVILFVSESVEVSRKGLKVLLRALGLLEERDFVIALVGQGDFSIPKELQNTPVFYLGTIIEERLMAVVYNAADLFVIPSLIDNLPNTAIEAICCGTPVVGFHTGGIPDIIEHEVNGRLANEIDAESLAMEIDIALKNLDSFDAAIISANARQKYKLEKQARAYLELFEKCR